MLLALVKSDLFLPGRMMPDKGKIARWLLKTLEVLF
jgi:hypothetical protein